MRRLLSPVAELSSDVRTDADVETHIQRPGELDCTDFPIFSQVREYRWT